MGAGLIDDHFVHTISPNTILSGYNFVHTILSVPFCPLLFCPREPCLLVLRLSLRDVT